MSEQQEIKPFKEAIIYVPSTDMDKIIEPIFTFLRDINKTKDFANSTHNYTGEKGNVIFSMSSGDFTSEDLKTAHLLKPIKVNIIVPNGEQNKNQNSYSPHSSSVNIYLDEILYLYGRQMYKDLIRYPQFALMSLRAWVMNEYSETTYSMIMNISTYEATVYHELSHWYRDATGGGFLGKLLDTKSSDETSEQWNDRIAKTIGIKNFQVFSDYEVDAQAHALFSVKSFIDNKTPGRWDSYGFEDLFDIFVRNWGAYIRMYYKKHKEEVEDWILRLWKRCYREPGLLSDKMKRLDVEAVVKHAYSLKIILETVEDMDKYYSRRSKWWDESTWRVIF